MTHPFDQTLRLYQLARPNRDEERCARHVSGFVRNKTACPRVWLVAGSKGTVLTAADHNPAFESVVLVHLDAAYNLARWLTANDHDAQDIVQDACLRAMRAFDTLRGADARAWLLAIVRNQCMTFLRGRRSPASFDPDLHDVGDLDADPDLILVRAGDVQLMREAIESLPIDLRTTVVLREIEGLTYKHIASVTGVPIGTVMSRLSRGRQRLAQWLSTRDQVGGLP